MRNSAAMPPDGLTLRQRLTWCAHLFKAVAKQHHGELRPLLRRYIASDSIVLDVGAHAGQFAKLFAGLASRGRVYAFEPSAYALSLLRPMVRVRRLRNVTVIAAGLSDAPGEAVLALPVKRSGSLGFGLAHLGADESDGRPRLQQTVPILTIDQFARSNDLARVDFIKADIEGWEIRMLHGGRETLARFRPAVLVELSSAHLSRAGNRPEEAFALLGPLGYRAFRLDDPQRNLPAFAGDGDYLFVGR
ncbi:MAG TPA: FkbM family methyltransferase [Candidatus Cybelea sp.]|nr:FkbM family methyltransferase [Candidatus Cybelea sp.]